MTNKEAIFELKMMKQMVKKDSLADVALDLAIKALEKEKCSSCKHYDKDYGETCLNPEGTCRVFEYDGFEKGDRE